MGLPACAPDEVLFDVKKRYEVRKENEERPHTIVDLEHVNKVKEVQVQTRK